MYGAIVTAVIGSAMYGMMGYAKELASKGEKFSPVKMARTLIIGAIIGVLVGVGGYDPKSAEEFSSMLFMIVGGDVLVEKLIRIAEEKLKRW